MKCKLLTNIFFISDGMKYEKNTVVDEYISEVVKPKQENINHISRRRKKFTVGECYDFEKSAKEQ